MRLTILAIFYCCITSSSLLSQTSKSNIDVQIFRSINNNRSQSLKSITNIVDYSVYPISIGLPIGLIGYGFLTNSKYEEDSGFLLSATELLSIITYLPLKHTIKRPRPYDKLENVHTGHLETASKYSFPSGHSTLATGITTLLIFRYPQPEIYIPALSWAFLAGYSRIYYGLHYPSDVLAGMAIGFCAGILVHHFEEEIINSKQKFLGNLPSIFIIPINGKILVQVKI